MLLFNQSPKGVKMKIVEQKNGNYTVFEKLPSGYYLVKLCSSTGALMDKMLCDTYAGAREYLRAFNAIAKNGC